MPNPVLDDLTSNVTKAEGAMDSATVLINGIQAKLDAAVAKALENGATAVELAPLSSLSTELGSKADALAAAVAANP